jgi:acetoacetyl-CoA synthetase
MAPRQSAETQTANTPRRSGISVRPTTPADTAEICDLLEHGFVRSGIAADGWRPVCTTNWPADTPTRGFVVTDGGRIVGHVGTIYSQREINGKTGIVCNFSGYYVAPAYRGRGLGAALTAAAVRDERITYTSLTPALVTQHVLEALGFAILDRRILLFPPGLNAETLWQSRVDIDVNDRTVRASLGQAERLIYDDHASYDCLHMTARDAGGTAYLVVKRRLHRVAWSAGIPFSQILYCSAPDVLARNLERIKLAIMWQQKTFGIAMNERLFPKAPRAIRERDIAQYRSPVFTPNELDLLYSEFVLLDIIRESRVPTWRGALRILRRSWITFCSWVRQSMASQSSATSSGPFTAMVSNLPLRFIRPSASVFNGSPADVSTLSSPAPSTGPRRRDQTDPQRHPHSGV